MIYSGGVHENAVIICNYQASGLMGWCMLGKGWVMRVVVRGENMAGEKSQQLRSAQKDYCSDGETGLVKY